MKKGLMDLFLKEGIEYRGIIVREADGHSVHLNFNRVPSADFAAHMVQVLNARNDLAKQDQRVTVVEEFIYDKATLIARVLELNRQAGLPGICKAQCKQGVVK